MLGRGAAQPERRGVDNYVLLAPDGRSGPNLLLQKVPEGKEEARVLTSVTEDLGPLLTEDGCALAQPRGS